MKINNVVLKSEDENDTFIAFKVARFRSCNIINEISWEQVISISGKHTENCKKYNKEFEHCMITSSNEFYRFTGIISSTFTFV